MTFTYSGDPATSPRDAVRFLAQDTRVDAHVLEDEEVDWILTQHGNAYLAAAEAARAIAARYAVQVDKTVGALRISAGQRQEHYLKLAGELESSSAGGKILPKPWARSLSQSEKNTAAQDPDRPKPSFPETLMDPPAGYQDGPYPIVVPIPDR